MQTTRSKIEYVPTMIFIVVGVFLYLLSTGGAATAGTYADSAHGDDSSGVNRSTATCENWPGGVCSIGSCAHCHDTFDPTICGNDPNGLMLFAPNDNLTSQTDNFCFQCHESDGDVQVGGVTNNNYGKTFGGGTADSTNIKDALAFGPPVGNPGSSHNLLYVRNWTKGRAFAPWVTDDTNACIICHDHHWAQKNTDVDPHPLGGVKTAIRRTVDGTDNTSDQWGDEPMATSGRVEMMSDYTTLYQAPLRADSGYEPKLDSTIQNGSNLPNFVDFCNGKCHSKSINDGKSDAVDGRDLYAINWDSDGDQHGKAYQPGHGIDGKLGELKFPYSDDGSYVLSCTDCHEPHGSPNAFLLRTSVNGIEDIEVQSDLTEFCSACHVVYTGPAQHSQGNCTLCHRHTNWYNGEPAF